MTSYEISLMGFQPGVRVRVIKQAKYKTDTLIGKTGVIDSVYGTSITVKLDGLRNSRSGRGVYYLTPSELEIVDEEFDKETKENIMHNVTNYLNIAKVKFVDGMSNNDRTYDYANYDAHLKVDDLCVVKTAHHGFSLAKVVEIVERNDLETQREIVSIVNTEAYDLRVATRAKVAELKTKMEERAKQLQDIALYQMLAKEDPAMKDLLNEFQMLPKM